MYFVLVGILKMLITWKSCRVPFLSVIWAPCDANENMEDIEFNLHKHRCSH